MLAAIRMTCSLLKLRIGVTIAASALAGIAVANGPVPAAWQTLALALAVLGASGAAGAFNHYYERDLDRLMRRTRGRPFARGASAPNGNSRAQTRRPSRRFCAISASAMRPSPAASIT